MKRVAAAIMVMALTLSMSGCFLVNGKQYKKSKDKVFSAADEACGAQVLSEDEVEELMDLNEKDEELPEEYQELLDGGICVELSKDQIEERLDTLDLEDVTQLDDDAGFSVEDLQNIALFVKKEGDISKDSDIEEYGNIGVIMATVIDFKKKSVCEDVFDELFASYKQMAMLMDISAGRDDSLKCASEKGKRDIGLLIVQEDGLSMAMYIERAGDTITMVTCTAPSDSDLFEEFLEFDEIAGFAGFRTMYEEL